MISSCNTSFGEVPLTNPLKPRSHNDYRPFGNGAVTENRLNGGGVDPCIYPKIVISGCPTALPDPVAIASVATCGRTGIFQPSEAFKVIDTGREKQSKGRFTVDHNTVGRHNLLRATWLWLSREKPPTTILGQTALRGDLCGIVGVSIMATL